MTTLQMIQKSIKVFKIISLVMMILSFAGAVCMLTCVGVYMAESNAPAQIEGAAALIQDVAGRTEYNDVISVLWCNAVLCITDGILLSAVFSYLSKELKDGSPFTERGEKQIRHLGVKVIVLNAVASIICGVICSCYHTAAPENIVNVVTIVLGVTLIILSLVFRYGAELEKSSGRETV